MGNECITQAHDVRAALANYDKALSLDPNYIDAWIRKGITLFNSKEYFDAENCFNTAVSLHPANFKAVYNRGKLRLKTENTEGAIADLDKATSLKPEHAGAHELFGDALLKAGKEVEAVTMENCRGTEEKEEVINLHKRRRQKPTVFFLTDQHPVPHRGRTYSSPRKRALLTEERIPHLQSLGEPLYP